jgi:hypothetical protein
MFEDFPQQTGGRMTQKHNIRALLLFALVFVSLAGWLVHLRVHPPTAAVANLIPFLAGIISIVIVPAMFLANATKAFAYVINGMLAIIGTITMGYFSIKHLPVNPSFTILLTGTLFADILICFNVLLIGKALFELDVFNAIDAPAREGRLWRYPNMGWWWVHLFALSAVFMLGHYFWK